MIFTMSPLIITFSGFRSRCTMPMECAIEPVFSVERPLDRHRQRQRRAVLLTAFRRAVVAETARRTLLHQADVAIVESRQDIAADVSVAADALLQMLVLVHEPDLRC